MTLDIINDGDSEADVWAKVNALLEATVAVDPVVDNETGLSVRTKINQAIAAVNAFEGSSGADFSAVFPNTFLVSATDPDANFTSLTEVRNYPSFVAGSYPNANDGSLVLFKRGEMFRGTLYPPVENMRFGCYGDPDEDPPIIGHSQELDLNSVNWVNESATKPGVWYIDVTSDMVPRRCAFWTLSGSLGFWEGRGLINSGINEGQYADTSANTSINVRGTSTANWTNYTTTGVASPITTLWLSNAAGSFTADSPPYAISLDGGSPVGTKFSPLEMDTVGDFRSASGSVVSLVYNTVNPFTAYGSIILSSMWNSVNNGGSSRRIRVFTGGQHPNLVFSRILLGGHCNAGTRSLDLGINGGNTGHGQTFSDIWFTGSDSSVAADSPWDDITFINCKMWLNNTRGLKVENGDARWTLINCQADDNGSFISQDGNGLVVGGSATAHITDFHMIGGRCTFNGSDNYVSNLDEGSCSYLENVLFMGGCENEMDCKQYGETRMSGCLNIEIPLVAQGSGTGPLAVQSKNRLFARDSVFISTPSSLNIASDSTEIDIAPNCYVHMQNCIFFALQAGTGAVGIASYDSTNVGPADQLLGEFNFDGCLLIDSSGQAATGAIRISAGHLKMRQCTLATRNASAGGTLVRVTPGSGNNATFRCTNMKVELENTILYSDATGTSYLVDRNSAAANTDVVVTADDCIWFNAAAPTNWARGDTGPTVYTAAEIDAGITLGTPEYFRVTNSALVTDPTADPMFDNQWEGVMPAYPEFRVGNYQIGGNLYALEFASAPAVPTMLGIKVHGVSSGATGYIRNSHRSGGPKNYILSSVSGTFTNGEVVADQWNQTLGTLAGSGAFVGPLVLRTLVWDAQSANFSTMGQIVTGSLSSDTAYLLSQVDGGSAGRMVVAMVSTDTFADNDVVSGAVEGSCTLDRVAQESPARASSHWLGTEVLATCVPSNQSFDIDTIPVSFTKINDRFFKIFNSSLDSAGGDTISVNTGTRTWSRSSTAFPATLLGLQFKTNNAGATTDDGGPYTVESVDVATRSFVTVETPPATITNDADMSLYPTFGQDTGCYPIRQD